MLYFMAVWILLLSACCLIGTALLNLLPANNFERTGDRFIAAQWLGIVVLSVTLLAASLIVPLSPLVGAIVIAGLCALSLLSPPTRSEIAALKNQSWQIFVGGLGLAVSIAALTTRQVTWIDTGLYHYQIIQWLAQYGAVPGMTLLFGNLGFTSSWFALAAPLNAAVFDSRASAVTNGFVFLLVILQLLICLSDVLKKQARLSDWFVVAFLGMILPIVFGLKLLLDILVSPSPDIPTIFLIEVVAWAILVISGRSKLAQTTSDKAEIVPLIISAAAVTIKLIAIPLLLVTGLYFVLNQRSIKKNLWGATIASLILLPMLVSSAITSACPLYPSAFLCLDLPWSLSSSDIQGVAAGTHHWVPWLNSSVDGVRGSIGLLWQWLTSSSLNKVMALLMVVSAACAVLMLKVLIKSRRFAPIWVGAIGITGITFIMFTSPLFRFGLSYMTLLPALFVAMLCSRFENRFFQSIAPLNSRYSASLMSKFIPFGSVLLAAFLVALAIDRSPFQLLLPPPLKTVQVVQKQTNDITFLMPVNDLCWATKIPCAFQVTPDIELRDPARGVKAGFVREK